MWWNIIKSSRDEAYQNFLDSLFAGGFQEEKEIPGIRGVGLIEDPWFVVANDELTGIEIYGTNNEMNQYREFIMGMFEQEYPQAYQELKLKILEITPKNSGWNIVDAPPVPTSPEDLPDFRTMNIRQKRKWLGRHTFTHAGNPLTKAEKYNLLGALMSFYDNLETGRIALALERMYEGGAFFGTHNLKLLFRKYDELLKGEVDINNATLAPETQEELMTTGDRIHLLLNILEGNLNENVWFRTHFSRGLNVISVQPEN